MSLGDILGDVQGELGADVAGEAEEGEDGAVTLRCCASNRAGPLIIHIHMNMREEASTSWRRLYRCRCCLRALMLFLQVATPAILVAAQREP